MDFWVTNEKSFIEKYYKTYLLAIEYLMGWVVEVQELAEHFKPTGNQVSSSINNNNRILVSNSNEIDYYKTNSNQKINDLIVLGDDNNKSDEILIGDDACNMAAAVIRKLGTNKSLMKADYSFIKSYFTMLIELRKGFYCTICDGENHERLTKAWQKMNYHDNINQNFDKFVMGKAFCSKFSNIAIPYVLYIFETLKDYLDATTTLLVCQKEKLISMKAEQELTSQNKKIKFETRPVYKVTGKEKQTFQECSTLKGIGKFFACKKFCTWFDLTSPNKILDGDVFQIKKFVSFVKHNKNLFNDSTNNVLVNDPQQSEAILSMNWNNVFVKKTFFESSDKFGVMDNQNTIVVEDEGIDPFTSSADNGYMLNLESFQILQFLQIFIIFVLYK